MVNLMLEFCLGCRGDIVVILALAPGGEWLTLPTSMGQSPFQCQWPRVSTLRKALPLIIHIQNITRLFLTDAAVFLSRYR